MGVTFKSHLEAAVGALTVEEKKQRAIVETSTSTPSEPGKVHRNVRWLKTEQARTATKATSQSKKNTSPQPSPNAVNQKQTSRNLSPIPTLKTLSAMEDSADRFVDGQAALELYKTK